MPQVSRTVVRSRAGYRCRGAFAVPEPWNVDRPASYSAGHYVDLVVHAGFEIGSGMGTPPSSSVERTMWSKRIHDFQSQSLGFHRQKTPRCDATANSMHGIEIEPIFSNQRRESTPLPSGSWWRIHVCLPEGRSLSGTKWQ